VLHKDEESRREDTQQRKLKHNCESREEVRLIDERHEQKLSVAFGNPGSGNGSEDTWVGSYSSQP
jgi:hypothetical protein